MKVIIDTNILISAALSDGKPEQAIELVLRHSDYEWIASEEILQEYLEVLNKMLSAVPTQNLRFGWG